MDVKLSKFGWYPKKYKNNTKMTGRLKMKFIV